MDSNIHKNNIKERSFGRVFSMIFFLLSLYLFFKTETLNFSFIVIGFVLLLLSIFKPFWLSFPTKIWFKFGELISIITSPIIMFVIFYFLITPISLIFKILNKKLLIKTGQVDSYWSNRDSSGTDLNQQF